MLSIGKIKLDGEGYYLEAVATGVDEYYRGVGEAPGRWIGATATDLGLAGEVMPDQLRAVLGGLDPASGLKLGRFAGREVAGFDLTFRAPKSVSLLGLMGADELAGAVRHAHDGAVDAAMSYIEDTVIRSRTGKNGVGAIAVQGLVAAAFRHRTSRAGDPHLHTHVLVSNMAQGVDGTWRTLDGRSLYQYASTAGYLYEAHLRHELTRRLGVAWEPVENGIADVSGIDQVVLDHFSDRRQQIEDHLEATGFRSARAAEVAALATRQRKPQAHAGATMRDVWADKAAAIGFDPTTLEATVDQVPRQSPTVDHDWLHDHLLSADGLTKSASTVARRDVLRAVAGQLPAGATVATVNDLADDLVSDPDVVRLAVDSPDCRLRSNTIRRADGTVIGAGIHEARWTTPELLSVEQAIVGRSVARTEEGAGRVAPWVVDQVVARHTTLADEQAAMVRTLTQSGDGVEVVCAAAGTGKTFTLAAACQTWEADGYRVIGAALSGRAADELKTGAGIRSSTLAMLKINLDAGRVRLDPDTVVVIDEAGMAGTRTLGPIMAAADLAGAKVVIVGDPHQLGEIDAGGVLRGLVDRLPIIDLTENRRQEQPWERQALAELRHGDVDTAFDAYQRHGRVVTAPTADDVRQAIVDDWWDRRATGESVAMMAARRIDVEDLNRRARDRMLYAGELSGPVLAIDRRPYMAGDHIVCLRNDRHLDVRNGTRAVVTSVDPVRRTLTMTTDRHKRVTLPADYLGAGHIAHGYATTIHKAQGATFDHALLFGTDALDRSSAYVGLSRGRKTNHLYVAGATPADDSTSHGPPTLNQELMEAVRDAMSHRTEKRLALDMGVPEDAEDPLWLEVDRIGAEDTTVEAPAFDVERPEGDGLPRLTPFRRREAEGPGLGIGL